MLRALLISFLLCVECLAHDPVHIRYAKLGDPEFDEARHLLYKVYVEEQGWNPQNDPSGLRIEQGKFGPMLVNDYDKQSMRLVLYHGEKCIGTIRLAGMIDGKFEVEHYIRLPPFIDGARAAHPDRMLELNRLAIAKEYRGKRVSYWGEVETAADVLFEGVQVFRAAGYTLFGAPTSEIAETAGRRWLGTFVHEEHKYHPEDPNTVKFVAGIGGNGMGTLFRKRLERAPSNNKLHCERVTQYLRAMMRLSRQ